MREPWRSHYLQALGVDVYVARGVLPGAAPSPVCEWDWAALAAPQPEREQAPVPAPVAAVPTAARLAPVVEVNAPRRADTVPVPVVRAAAARPQDGAIPRFALSVAPSDCGILIVDEAPPAQAARADYLRLLGNLLFALQRKNASVNLDVFMWPMIRNAQIDQGADAAREAIAAYLHKQVQSRSIHTVLLLGDTAQRWLPAAVRPQLATTCVASSSAWACLRETALKRQLWNDIRHLVVAPA